MSQASLVGARSAMGGSTVTQELELVYWKDVKDSTDRDGTDWLPRQVPGGHLRRPGAPPLAQARRRQQYARPDRSQRHDVPDVPVEPAGPRGHPCPHRHNPVGGDAADAFWRGIQPPRSRSRRSRAVRPGMRQPRTSPSEPPASWLPSPSPSRLSPCRTQEEALRRVRGARRSGGGRCRGPVPDGKSRSRASVATPASAASSPAAAAAWRRRASACDRRRCAAPHGRPRPADARSAAAPARRPATVAKVKGVAPAPAPENSHVAVSEPVPQRQERRPASTHATAVAQNAVETCKDKFFLLKEFCLAEQCEKPGARNHAAVHEAPGRSQAARGEQGPQLAGTASAVMPDLIRHPCLRSCNVDAGSSPA